MGYNDTWNSRQLASYLSRCGIEDVFGDGWCGVGRLKATYVDYSYDHIEVVAKVEITDPDRAYNSEISAYISRFVNSMIDEYGKKYTKALLETPPKIDLIIKKV